eukprot:6829302-Prymnesium_polylepis.1
MVCPISAQFCGCFALIRGCFAAVSRCFAYVAECSSRCEYVIRSHCGYGFMRPLENLLRYGIMALWRYAPPQHLCVMALWRYGSASPPAL